MGAVIRRVVTGHDANGRAKLLFDGEGRQIQFRPGVETALLWTTSGFPVSNEGDEDAALADIATSRDGGTVFRIVDFAPGNTPRVHRTLSIDYGVVMQGEIEMELEPGEPTVKLKAGDVLVQRGTIHNWINRGPGVCRIAFILVAASPVQGMPAQG